LKLKAKTQLFYIYHHHSYHSNHNFTHSNIYLSRKLSPVQYNQRKPKIKETIKVAEPIFKTTW